jgi:hypothetical protein
MIKTRHTRPDHPVVGRFFIAWNNGEQCYYCGSYDPAIGYWMTNIRDIQDRRNVSERAPGRTYHEVYDSEGRKRARLGITDATADEVERGLVEAGLWER